ncbi:MAG TPA: SGNH/GDSL hydrolase family protein [Chitinophagaceae bacterium]|nr:SGNH/GDSL hydrolase family protein [Chitinophagaceae bacterium]
MNAVLNKYFSLLIAFTFSLLIINAQQLPVEESKITKQYPQISLVFNRIFNSGGLDSFYQKLYHLKKKKKGLVSIVHIGDSHLQSDNLPGVVRKELQDFFGDAGKGTVLSRELSANDPFIKKDSTGVLYQAIGINGARYETFNQSSSFWSQLPALKADLFIISLGTNDAQANTINDAEFQKQVTVFLDHLKKVSPAASVLITTTADSFKGGNPNRQLWDINLSLFSYCTSHSIPVWDMYRVTNGFGSAYNWYKKGMMNGDGIHFTANAYKIQGRLLYNAIAKGYNSYVSSY